MQPFNIEFRSNEGYGDFITGLCYAHSSVIKYQRPVNITFHWPNAENHLFSPQDSETILYRFNHILSYLKPVDGLTIFHKFSSSPKYRFINELEEFNPLHGLWYLKHKPVIVPKKVVFWSSKHNVKFPGYQKDPMYNYWPDIIKQLEQQGYSISEITYRTPVAKVMEDITTCEFGIGYEGMIHQLFKFTWRPIVIGSRRVKLSQLLAPQGCVLSDPKELLVNGVHQYVEKSKKNIDILKKYHYNYINKIEDPTTHPLYNKVN